jgi:fatty acid desaturase
MDRKKILETGLVIVTGLLAIFMMTSKPWIIPVTAVIGAIFIFVPPLARLIHVAWISLAKVLGWVMPKLILSIIWFVIFTPLAFVYRLTGHDELQLKKTKDPQFSDCPKVYSPSDFEKLW